MLKPIHYLSKTLICYMNNKIKDVLDIGPSCYERFIKSSTLSNMKSLEIELAGCSNLSGKYCVARTNPPDHTLFYTLSGQGKLLTHEQTYALTPNTLAILPAKQAFSVSIAAPHWDIFWINLANTKRWEHIASNKALVLENQQLDALHLTMELLFVEGNTDLHNGLVPILSHYLHNTLSGQERPKTPVIDTNERLHSLFKEVEKRLQYQWSIEAMCEHVHYSPPHLHRLSQRAYGRSPIQQLIHLRIERSQNLLLNTQWPISHIANYVGYSNIFNFSKRFKKSVGVSPSDFRRAKKTSSM